MTKICLIAAVDTSLGLGKDNQLLCHLPADLQHFKAVTMGKPIIMGRKTYDSIGRALPGRLNIVLSKRETFLEGVEVVDSLSKALTLASDAEEIMVIGGARVYQKSISLASTIYLTHIHHQFNADVFFPQLEQSIWCCEEKVFQPRDERNAFDMTFCRYERIGD